MFIIRKADVSTIKTILGESNKDTFLLIVDSWGGQVNPSSYDEIFTIEENEVMCSDSTKIHWIMSPAMFIL